MVMRMVEKDAMMLGLVSMPRTMAFRRMAAMTKAWTRRDSIQMARVRRGVETFFLSRREIRSDSLMVVSGRWGVLWFSMGVLLLGIAVGSEPN